MDKNKVKYGLKDVHYALATIAADGSATYEKPVAFPGAVSLSMDAQGDNTPFRADDMDYYVSNGNDGYQGALEMALYDDEFRKAVLNEQVAGNGIQYESAGAEIKHFALLFQFKGDKNNTRHVLYNCTASRPSVASKTTPRGGKNPETESSTITSIPIYVPDLEADVVKGKVSPGDAAYETWFESVTLPTKATEGES